jgi:hypothetical protein
MVFSAHFARMARYAQGECLEPHLAQCTEMKPKSLLAKLGQFQRGHWRRPSGAWVRQWFLRYSPKGKSNKTLREGQKELSCVTIGSRKCYNDFGSQVDNS